MHPCWRDRGRPGPEVALALGAFLVGYLKRFGVLGAGIGSQIYIGQLLAYGAGLTRADLPTVAVAGSIAALAAIVPRLLSGPAEHPATGPMVEAAPAGGRSRELLMGLQAAVAAVVIVALNDAVGLEESAWAITACTYVIANSTSGTIDRVRRRILGTVLGVPLGLACLPIAAQLPLLIWALAALAMVIYAMALPERYDVACGAYAFTLIVTLAASGEHAPMLLAARAWETLVGGALGLAAALLVFPIRAAVTSR
ncbi:MAG TPA: FUSC family protein [Acetobacteraceae bacterium]|nr:FUSC family protein [Acetobacteraceae bacterium]